MSGFDPVGSTPVAAIGSGGPPVGTYLSPGVGFLTATGLTPSVNGIGQVSNAALVRETLRGGPGQINASGIVKEVLYSRVVAAVNAGIVRETMRGADGQIRNAGVVREVLRSGGSGAATQQGFISILW